MDVSRKLSLFVVLMFGALSVIAYAGIARPAVEGKAVGPAEIYSKNCTECHGTDGRAKTPKGQRLAATDFTKKDWSADEARGIRIITKGKSDMPSFKDKLTADEIREVFGYVVKFRK